jgi:hypothetical protein
VQKLGGDAGTRACWVDVRADLYKHQNKPGYRPSSMSRPCAITADYSPAIMSIQRVQSRPQQRIPPRLMYAKSGDSCRITHLTGSRALWPLGAPTLVSIQGNASHLRETGLVMESTLSRSQMKAFPLGL